MHGAGSAPEPPPYSPYYVMTYMYVSYSVVYNLISLKALYYEYMFVF